MPATEEYLLTLLIQSIELREIRLPLIHFFETSFGRTIERRILLARLTDANGVEGWGECVAGEGPFYSDEWTDTVWATLREFLAPIMLGKQVETAADVFALMKPVRGHRMAKATIETACWDLEAKNARVPLWKHLGGTRSEIACGVSIGIQDSPEMLLEKIRTEVDAGYQRIKIKIKPGWDLGIVQRVRREFPDIRLMGDANSAYKLSDVPLFQQLDQFNLMMLEQPLARDNEIPVWCGGMLESGIGRAHNIAMSTLAGFTLPGDVSASARYWEDDIIEPPVEVSERGTIKPPEAPGIGFNVNVKRIEALTARKETIK